MHHFDLVMRTLACWCVALEDVSNSFNMQGSPFKSIAKVHCTLKFTNQL
jgi:hypothetical protein